ncbi:MAG: hypothetical protein JW862_19035 [Anaerolineales bacterium]|nr:hypothetical protein [Anaerolineales bacterium]
MPLQPVRFIGEPVEVLFDQPPLLEKKPGCPDGFLWQDQTWVVQELLSEWYDFSRRGDKARNMQPHNLRKAQRRGSLGVGRFYFQVRAVVSGAEQPEHPAHIFELYYDRAWQGVDDRKGAWTLFRELSAEP